MIKKIIDRGKRLFYFKTNQAKLVRYLGIDAAEPESVHIYGHVDFGSEPWIISMGKNIHLTDGVKFICHDGGTLLYRELIPDLEITKPIKLGDDVYIGNNVILLPGVSIGSNVVIGAGALVTKDIPSNEVWGGVPAKKIKTSEEYFEKIQQESLHLGHLKGAEKDAALRKLYGRSKDE